MLDPKRAAEPKSKIGLGRIGFNVHHHDFFGKNTQTLKEVFEQLTPVSSATTISVQWSDSEFVGMVPTVVKVAKQVGLTPIVSLSITKGRFPSLTPLLQAPQ